MELLGPIHRPSIVVLELVGRETYIFLDCSHRSGITRAGAVDDILRLLSHSQWPLCLPLLQATPPPRQGLQWSWLPCLPTSRLPRDLRHPVFYHFSKQRLSGAVHSFCSTVTPSSERFPPSQLAWVATHLPRSASVFLLSHRPRSFFVDISVICALGQSVSFVSLPVSLRFVFLSSPLLPLHHQHQRSITQPACFIAPFLLPNHSLHPNTPL